MNGSVDTTNDRTAMAAPAAPSAVPRAPLALCAMLGLGGLFSGVTGPLLSTFVPPVVRGVLGDHRTAIGLVMAIDNVLLLLLVPWAGAASDRASGRGRGRLPIVIAGFALAAAGMALFPVSATFGIAGVIVALVVLYGGTSLQRAPFQALVADLVPSRYRSLATGSVTFQMCAGAILFLMLGRMLGLRPAFWIAAATVIAIGATFALGFREPAVSESRAGETTYRSLLDAFRVAIRGAVPGMRAIFAATLLLQLTFQTFTTWYALHGTERFGVRPEDVTTGFIAWAMGGVVGSLPAGVIGVRLGRRRAMLLGLTSMALCLLALDRITSVTYAAPLLALASASWTLPTVNSYPMFVESIPMSSRGSLTALFLLCTALGGAIGDPLNGGVFDWVGGYRPLFLMMTSYTVLAALAILLVPRGTGEAGTGVATTA